MALTYDQSAALMNDMSFRGRVKVALLKYADTIFLEPNTVAAHNTRVKWASTTEQQPDQVAATYTPPVVMDPAVQTDGSTISDAALQGSVQAVVDRLL